MTIREIADAWQGRPTFAVIDLDALATNIRTMREHIGPAVKMMAVVKANGFGHGAVPVAETVLANGATSVAVATVDEGAQLREAGITAPILVFGPMGSAERDPAVGMGMSIVISDIPFAKGLARVVRMHPRKEPIQVHLKIDTGMRRFGVLPQEVVNGARTIQSFPELKLEGLMTQLASADEVDISSVHRQVEIFDKCVEMLREAGIEVPIHHVCNGAATVRFPQYHKDMVRPGLVLYGVRPASHIPFPGVPGAMKQILTIHSMVTRVIPLKKGDRVGYGGSWEAKEETRGAMVPIGYTDGYLRSLSNRGWMSIDGARADVIGHVCMDQTILHLPQGLPAETRQRVILIGNGTYETKGAPTLEELAEVGGTIPQELMATMAPRLPKLYKRNGKLIAVSDLGGYRKV
jgi:alanine racemase